jgi:hypothetical protein
MRYYLLPIGDREPLECILRESRTAFPPTAGVTHQSLRQAIRSSLHHARLLSKPDA